MFGMPEAVKRVALILNDMNFRDSIVSLEQTAGT
jgi:hypothetical protein